MHGMISFFMNNSNNSTINRAKEEGIQIWYEMKCVYPAYTARYQIQ